MSIRRSLFLGLNSFQGGLRNVRSQTPSRRRSLTVEKLEDRRLLAVVELSALNAAQGSIIYGADANDRSGFSVSQAGDVNGDGFEDFIIGAYRGYSIDDSRAVAGDSFVVFGSLSMAATVDLENLGSGGVAIHGVDPADRSGSSVSGGGDINGDGFADLVVGAHFASAANNAKTRAGDGYVVFGAASLPNAIDLRFLGSAGVTIYGSETQDRNGTSVHIVGDVNGDGYDDFMLGAPGADASGNSKSSSGDSYMIFGGPSLPTVVDLNNLGSLGIAFYGAEANDESGFFVSGAGDMNGDGYHEFVIGARFADAFNNLKSGAGDCYVIWGKADWSTASTIDLANLGSVGMTIYGADTGDRAGFSLDAAGDVNGDGFDDLLIGAYTADGLGNSRQNAGDSYVIYGQNTLPATLNLATLGSAGITIYGVDPNDLGGTSVSSAGDVNGDGYDDLVIGAFNGDGASNSQVNSGDTFVVFGGPSIPNTLNLSSLGANGITLFGAEAADLSGISVSGVGDVNGDGFDDFLIGAHNADAFDNLKTYAGESYLVYGSNSTGAITHPGTPNSEVLTGTASADVINGAQDDDELISNGGADVLLGGQGNDSIVISSLAFRRVVGGTGSDTLKILANNLTLDLTSIPDNRIQEIESIDLTGSGSNTLILNQREVLNLSDSSNTLMVRKDGGDFVDRGAGWTQGADQSIGGQSFNLFTNGLARLLIQLEDVVPPTITSIIVAGSTWSSGFIDTVDGGGINSGNGLGYLLTAGAILPNSGFNRIYVQFSEPVIGFNATHIALLGVNVSDYSNTPGFLTVSYNATAMRGEISLASSIVKDKLRLGVSDAVTDVAMNSLDGDANASPGGDLDFRFNIIVGDANNDGSVNGGDLPFFGSSFNRSPSDPLYNARVDWNSDASVNGGDLPFFGSNFNQSLPTQEPATLNFPPSLSRELTSEQVSMLAPWIERDDEELIDDYFIRLEKSLDGSDAF
jgi:FG-GAP repeat/RTX calcium-binding nonapeptide repeat (4 copies)